MMTKKELIVIHDAIDHAKAVIEALACENYPYTDFYSVDLREMFYDLNTMCLKLSEKIEEAAK